MNNSASVRTPQIRVRDFGAIRNMENASPPRHFGAMRSMENVAPPPPSSEELFQLPDIFNPSYSNEAHGNNSNGLHAEPTSNFRGTLPNCNISPSPPTNPLQVSNHNNSNGLQPETIRQNVAQPNCNTTSTHSLHMPNNNSNGLQQNGNVSSYHQSTLQMSNNTNGGNCNVLYHQNTLQSSTNGGTIQYNVQTAITAPNCNTTPLSQLNSMQVPNNIGMSNAGSQSLAHTINHNFLVLNHYQTSNYHTNQAPPTYEGSILPQVPIDSVPRPCVNISMAGLSIPATTATTESATDVPLQLNGISYQQNNSSSEYISTSFTNTSAPNPTHQLDMHGRVVMRNVPQGEPGEVVLAKAPLVPLQQGDVRQIRPRSSPVNQPPQPQGTHKLPIAALPLQTYRPRSRLPTSRPPLPATTPVTRPAQPTMTPVTRLALPTITPVSIPALPTSTTVSWTSPAIPSSVTIPVSERSNGYFMVTPAPFPAFQQYQQPASSTASLVYQPNPLWPPVSQANSVSNSVQNFTVYVGVPSLQPRFNGTGPTQPTAPNQQEASSNVTPTPRPENSKVVSKSAVPKSKKVWDEELRKIIPNTSPPKSKFDNYVKRKDKRRISKDAAKADPKPGSPSKDSDAQKPKQGNEISGDSAKAKNKISTKDSDVSKPKQGIPYSGDSAKADPKPEISNRDLIVPKPRHGNCSGTNDTNPVADNTGSIINDPKLQRCRVRLNSLTKAEIQRYSGPGTTNIEAKEETSTGTCPVLPTQQSRLQSLLTSTTKYRPCPRSRRPPSSGPAQVITIDESDDSPPTENSPTMPRLEPAATSTPAPNGVARKLIIPLAQEVNSLAGVPPTTGLQNHENPKNGFTNRVVSIAVTPVSQAVPKSTSGSYEVPTTKAVHTYSQNESSWMFVKSKSRPTTVAPPVSSPKTTTSDPQPSKPTVVPTPSQPSTSSLIDVCKVCSAKAVDGGINLWVNRRNFDILCATCVGRTVPGFGPVRRQLSDILEDLCAVTRSLTSDSEGDDTEDKLQSLERSVRSMNKVPCAKKRTRRRSDNVKHVPPPSHNSSPEPPIPKRKKINMLFSSDSDSDGSRR